MKVLGKLLDRAFNEYHIDNKTLHLTEERQKRLELYQDNAVFFHGFIVDKDHKNGLEVHFISEQGVIYIFNMNSTKFITTLNARPQQIKRYFRELGLSIDRNTYKAIDIAFKNNQEKNFNNK